MYMLFFRSEAPLARRPSGQPEPGVAPAAGRAADTGTAPQE